MHLGSILIYFALVLSLLSLFFLAKAAGGNLQARVTLRQIYYLSGLAVLAAAGMLLFAFLNHDFNLDYVYRYSSRDLPLLYLISAFWAGQEGSFLFWLMLIYGCGFFVLRSYDRDEPIIMSVITVTQIFLLIIVAVNSPFRHLKDTAPELFQAGIIPANIDGKGLNPLLKDFWMAVHPPVLFMGYAAALIPFAYAVAALLRNDYTTWIRSAYRWVIFSMVTLGLGIFFGGYWAYKVLGWGGYWGWDPVENSSLIPWLVIVALLHGMIVQRRRKALVKTNIALGLLGFIMVFYSSFLTRSGVLSDFSVHSFSASDISLHMVSYFLFYVFIALALFAKRFTEMRGDPLEEKILTYDNLISYGIITLLFFDALVFLGTSLPLFTRFLQRPASVTENYYNLIVVPFGILLLLFLTLVLIFGQAKKPRTRTLVISLSVSVMVATLFNALYTYNPFAYILSALAFYIVLSIFFQLITRRSRILLPRQLSHLGVAVLSLGIVASGLHSTTVQKILFKGSEEKIGDIALTYKGRQEKPDQVLNYTLRRGGITKEISTLYALDPGKNAPYREPYIGYGFFHDLYITPVTLRSGLEGVPPLVMVRGDVKESGDVKVRFRDFADRNMGKASGGVKLSVELEVERQGRKQTLTPGFEMDGKGEKKKSDALIPGTRRVISLAGVNPHNGEVELYVEPEKIPEESVIVEVSSKRLIWLVWAGTILIAAGGVFYYGRRDG